LLTVVARGAVEGESGAEARNLELLLADIHSSAFDVR
jgi:hypothetical protein